METFELNIETSNKKEIIPITKQINEILSKFSGADDCLCNVFVAHTTCAITTADLDPGTDLDMLDAFEEMIPKIKYRHPHDPSHVGDHIMSSIIGVNVTVPVKGNRLILGKWQEVVLIEFSGPRKRSLYITIM